MATGTRSLEVKFNEMSGGLHRLPATTQTFNLSSDLLVIVRAGLHSSRSHLLPNAPLFFFESRQLNLIQGCFERFKYRYLTSMSKS